MSKEYLRLFAQFILLRENKQRKCFLRFLIGKRFIAFEQYSLFVKTSLYTLDLKFLLSPKTPNKIS